MKLLVVPPSLGYGSKGISLPQVGAVGWGMCCFFGPLYVNSLSFHTFVCVLPLVWTSGGSTCQRQTVLRSGAPSVGA